MTAIEEDATDPAAPAAVRVTLCGVIDDDDAGSCVDGHVALAASRRRAKEAKAAAAMRAETKDATRARLAHESAAMASGIEASIRYAAANAASAERVGVKRLRGGNDGSSAQGGATEVGGMKKKAAGVSGAWDTLGDIPSSESSEEEE